jgi:ElaA protein
MSVNPSADSLQWQFLHFEEMSAQQLYALLQLRSEVFVVEQRCIYQDMDGGDLHAMHLLGSMAGKIVACARCFQKGQAFEQGAQPIETSIGRVVTHSSLRGQGAGHLLMREAIARTQALWGRVSIRISAQAHLQNFYAQHGFVAVGELYDEDGIPHQSMLRP